MHTRVPAVLEQELKRLAESLRMPVSNVVRAILEDAVTAVDVVGRKAEGEMNRVVDRMAEKRERLRHIANNKPEPGASGGGEVDAPEVGGERDAECDAERDDTTPDASAAKLEGVIGFQPLLLASSSTCSVCGQPLKAGTEAYLGVRDGTGPRVLIGPACLPKPDDD
ncbi:MAG: hypothetical protein ACOC1F_12485 [Myxococcota bacterium]